MILRLLHFLTQHKYRVASCVFNIGAGYFMTHAPRTENDRRSTWGFTEVLMQCECGSHKTLRLIGDHTGLKSSTELSELERIAKL